MTQRKKFLYAGMAINLAFFAATSAALVSYSLKDTQSFLNTQLRQVLRTEEMMLWEKQETARRFLKAYVSKGWTPTVAARVAPLGGIIAGLEAAENSEGKPQPLIADQPDEPIPRALFTNKKAGVVFHKEDTRIFLTFAIEPAEVPGLARRASVTLEQPLLALPAPSPRLQSDITVIENNWQGPQILHSTFTREVRADLLKRFVFDPDEPLATELNFDERHATFHTMIINNERYLAYPLYLINGPDFSQVAIYTFRIKDFVLIDNYEIILALIFVLTLCCSVTYMAYHLSQDDEDTVD